MLVLCLLCLAISLINSEVSNFRCGDPRVCYDEKGEKPFMIEVLPGFCWDNLVNENRGVVVNFNYSKCKTTEDRRYLLPDGVVTIPIKTSQMNVFSKLYDHWSQYESDTANSINIGASGSIEGVNIAASFSSEYEHIKNISWKISRSRPKFRRGLSDIQPKFFPMYSLTTHSVIVC